MFLNDLPNDILDIIYKMKHVTEMKDVSNELINFRIDKINDMMKVLRLFSNERMNFIDPDEIANIWTSFRNEGLITTEQLENVADSQLSYELTANSQLNTFLGKIQSCF